MLMRFIMWLLLGYIGFRIVRSLLTGRAATAPPSASGMETFQDPVCGVYVAADDAVIGRINNQRHYFCSLACLEKYREQLT